MGVKVVCTTSVLELCKKHGCAHNMGVRGVLCVF